MAGVTFVNETKENGVKNLFITLSKQDKSLRQYKCDHTQHIQYKG